MDGTPGQSEGDRSQDLDTIGAAQSSNRNRRGRRPTHHRFQARGPSLPKRPRPSSTAGSFRGTPVPLGEIRFETTTGRLVVLGGRGQSGFVPPGDAGLAHFADNDGWFDDTAEGPVTATVKLKTTGQTPAVSGARVVVGPPDYRAGDPELRHRLRHRVPDGARQGSPPDAQDLLVHAVRPPHPHARVRLSVGQRRGRRETRGAANGLRGLNGPACRSPTIGRFASADLPAVTRPSKFRQPVEGHAATVRRRGLRRRSSFARWP